MKLSKAFIISRIPSEIGVGKIGKGYLIDFKLEGENIMIALTPDSAQKLCMEIYKQERAQGRGQDLVDMLLKIVEEDLCLKSISPQKH